MTVTFIIAVALSTVLMLIFIGLALAVAYYRWRTAERMAGISIYIRTKWMMEQQIGELKKQINHIINKDV